MSKATDELLKALKAGNFNAKPTKLHQGGCGGPDCTCDTMFPPHGLECACAWCMFGDELPQSCGCDEQGPSFKCQSEGLWHCAPPPPEE